MREQFYARVSERHFRRLTDIYALTEDQKAQVKQQLQAITQRQREYTDPIMNDVETMFRERFAMEAQRRAGQPIDENRLSQVTDWLRQVRNQSPLMNFDNVANEVERLLPADQVAQAQQRRNASRAQEEARIAEWRRRRDEMRASRDAQRSLDQQQVQQPVGQEVQPEQGLSSDQLRQGEGTSGDPPSERGQRPNRQQRRLRSDAQEQIIQDQAQAQEGQDRPRDWRDRARDSRSTGDPWDDYVVAFIRRYHLDDSQQSSARSLLRMYKNERQQYRDARRSDYAAAEKIESDQKRRDELERLDKGIERLFDALKEKLERIPTDSQLAQYGSRRRSSGGRDGADSRPSSDSPRERPAESQPAAVEPQAAVTSQPA